MTNAVLHINDRSLAIMVGEGDVHAQVGFARHAQEGIESGEVARSTAWLEPQDSYNQYWCHLNQAPLASPKRWARHNADIAYAQLRSLWDSAGKPESLIVLVPGSVSDEQMSLIAGLLVALPATPLAIIDSALPVATAVSGDCVHVDLQLHQCVLSVLDNRQGKVRVSEQEVFPNLGMLQVYNSVAREISNQLIDSARFDPLHSSHAEQDIFDRMPGWIEKLRWDEEITDTLNTSKGELPFVLRRNKISTLLTERLTSAHGFLQRHSSKPIMLSSGADVLSSLSDHMRGATIFDDNKLLHASQSLAENIDSDGPLERIRSLEVAQNVGTDEPPAAVNSHRIPTHILISGSAVPLNSPVSIHLSGAELGYARRIDDNAELTIASRDGAIEVLRQTENVTGPVWDESTVGDRISVGEHELTLIEVLNG